MYYALDKLQSNNDQPLLQIQPLSSETHTPFPEQLGHAVEFVAAFSKFVVS